MRQQVKLILLAVLLASKTMAQGVIDVHSHIITNLGSSNKDTR